MRRASEAELARWERQSAHLAGTLRRHLPVAGFCPVCTWPNGRAQTDPCDITVEARVALRELCGEK